MINFLKSIFSKAYRIFKKFISAVFSSALQLFIAELKDFAIESVEHLSGVNMNNNDKRRRAFLEISEEAKRRGVKWKDSWINLIIELSLAYVKNKIKE